MTAIKFRALTHDDHKLFFEALGEYGKDFQNIQQYMTQKGNKSKTEQNNNRGSSDTQEKKDQDKKDDDKKRDQIRNFYNKIYARLSQLIGKLDDRVEKVNQELYLLINYGEIWKRHGFIFNNKTKRLLEDLLYQGSATSRIKSKNVRLRTPPCRALKKINQIGVDEKVKVVTTRELPKDVIVEFRPATNRDWLEVQAISQNPRVRARLSIQKRLSTILDFLERKWNISQDKLNHSIDAWLKLDSKSQQSINIDDLTPQQQQQYQQQIPYAPSNARNNQNSNNNNNNNNAQLVGNNSLGTSSHGISDNGSGNEMEQRLRLKPSPHHELKEVNITRVVPDYHLDLSLTAYVKRQGLTKPSTNNLTNGNQVNKGTSEPTNGDETGAQHLDNNMPISEKSNSRLPVSLTTPDCSILFEKSCTSDQPSSPITQTHKYLKRLNQSLPGVLDGDNSRMACEDTRSSSNIWNQITQNSNHRTTNSGQQHNRSVSFATNPVDAEVANHALTILVNNDIPALYDEDAALPAAPSRQSGSSSSERQLSIEAGSTLQQPAVFDSQTSKSADFDLGDAKNLIDFFKSKETPNENADDRDIEGEEVANGVVDEDAVESHLEDEQQMESPKDPSSATQNHLVDIHRLAQGWTRSDDASMTVGELFLALKCPEKIILEYCFEKVTNNDDAQTNPPVGDNTSSVQNSGDALKSIKNLTSDGSFIFKLLTAASVSLARIESQKREQQLKLHDQQQSCSKLKRRKLGSAVGGQGLNNMTIHDIEVTNQRVEEQLKQLQPTRLCSYRRAR